MMRENTIPVYLDCNYENIESAISKLKECEEISTSEASGPANTLSGELKARYGNGKIQEANLSQISNLIKTISYRMQTVLNQVEDIDHSLYESFRDYVERVLNYTTPIDHSKYPNLSDDTIEEIYNYILTTPTPAAFDFLKIKDLTERSDALKLVLSHCVGDSIPYLAVKDIYINSDENNREEIYDLLKYTDISFRPTNDLNWIVINRDEFDEITNILMNNNYDEETILLMYYGMNCISNAENNLKNDTQISLTFDKLKVNLTASDLLNYCTKNSFDYYKFFSDNIYNSDVSDDTRISFNLNGIDFSLTAKRLKRIINKMNSEGESIQNSNPLISDVDINQLNFMGHLYNYSAYNFDELFDKKRVNILGKNLYMSIDELSSCLDSNGNFDVNKLIENKKLTESEYIYYNAYLGNKLNLNDLKILAKGRALDFFYKYGGVEQSGVKFLASTSNSDYALEREKLINFCKNEYGLSEDEALIIMSSIDTVGACTMADTCNTIYELYDFDEEKFQNDFGYSMIKKEMVRGKLTDQVNDEVLLLDLYIQANTGNSESDNTLFLKDNDGKVTINDKYLIKEDNGKVYLDEHQAKYFGYDRGYRYDNLNEFLKSKSSNILEEYTITNLQNDNTIDKSSMYDTIVSAINDNKIVSVELSNNWEMYDVDSVGAAIYNDAHAVTMVGLTEDGALVESYGKLCYVPIEDCEAFNILEKK